MICFFLFKFVFVYYFLEPVSYSYLSGFMCYGKDYLFDRLVFDQFRLHID